MKIRKTKPQLPTPPTYPLVVSGDTVQLLPPKGTTILTVADSEYWYVIRINGDLRLTNLYNGLMWTVDSLWGTAPPERWKKVNAHVVIEQ